MNPSLFLEFVQKWFPSLSKIIEKVNGKREGKLTYLHKEMLRKEYSADQKWESASVDTTYVAADVVAMDSELPLKKRDSIQAANGDLPKIGMKMRLGEKQINTINILKARGNTYAQIVAKMTNDAVKCVTGVDERNEAIFLQGLSEGVTLVEDENNVGVGIRVNYKYPEANKFGVTIPWGNAGYTPITDLQRVIDLEDSSVGVIMLSKKAYNLIRKSDEAKELVANFDGKLVTSDAKLPVPTVKKFNEAFADEYFGIQFKVVDRTVKIEIDGKVKNLKPWNEDKIIFLTSDDEVGALVYGTLAEETNPVDGVNYSKANEYVLVSKYSKNDPLQEFTSAQSLCLPVIENVDQIYQLDITEQKEYKVVEEGGEEAQGAMATMSNTSTADTITFLGESYGKSDVISGLNSIGVTTSGNIGIPTLQARVDGLNEEQETALLAILKPKDE